MTGCFLSFWAKVEENFEAKWVVIINEFKNFTRIDDIKIRPGINPILRIERFDLLIEKME